MKMLTKFFKSLLGISSDSKTSGSTLILRVSLLGFAALLFWASQVVIDQTVHAPGQVFATAKTQVVQTADGGIVKTIHVKEGDEVLKDQVLVTLEQDRVQSSYDDAFKKEAALKMTIARLTSELNGAKTFNVDPQLAKINPELADEQRLQFIKRKKTLDDQVENLGAQKVIAEKEDAMFEKLVASNDVSQSDLIRTKSRIADLKTQISERQNQYLQLASQELAKAREDLGSVSETVNDRRQLLQQTELRAPMDGTIKNIRITTEGGVLKPSEDVMEILPAGTGFYVEAKLQPQDLGKVTPGMPAKIKFDAFDYTVYGVYNGTVTYISPDSLIDETVQQKPIYYKVKIQIDEADFKGGKGEEIKVLPGMTTNIDVLADTRTVLSYLTKPLTKTLNESLTEK